jgi:hypothetical protein
MPSMKCYQCGKVKKCRMVMVRYEEPRVTPGPSQRAEYLCTPCRRELGYA